jgi:putative transcriptional regulator
MLYIVFMSTLNLQNRLREHRKLAGGLTQQDLAERAGVSRQSIISIEQGRYRPTVELALKLARVLGCAVEDLFQLGDGEGG